MSKKRSIESTELKELSDSIEITVPPKKYMIEKYYNEFIYTQKNLTLKRRNAMTPEETEMMKNWSSFVTAKNQNDLAKAQARFEKVWFDWDYEEK